MAVAAATAAVAAYGAYSANKRGKEAMGQQEAAHADRMGIARDQMDFARGHYDWARGMFDDYRGQFDPVLDQLKTEAMADQTPDYGLITADTQAAFDSARDQEQRNLGRYGIKPGDGQWGSTERRYGIGQATAEVGARQSARRAAMGDRFNKLNSLYGIGAGLQSGAMGAMGTGVSAMSGAAGMGMNAAGGQANMYGNRAQTYGNLASSNSAAFMRNLGPMIDGAMNSGGGGASAYSVPMPSYMGGNVNFAGPGGGG